MSNFILKGPVLILSILLSCKNKEQPDGNKLLNENSFFIHETGFNRNNRFRETTYVYNDPFIELDLKQYYDDEPYLNASYAYLLKNGTTNDGMDVIQITSRFVVDENGKDVEFLNSTDLLNFMYYKNYDFVHTYKDKDDIFYVFKKREF